MDEKVELVLRTIDVHVHPKGYQQNRESRKDGDSTHNPVVLAGRCLFEIAMGTSGDARVVEFICRTSTTVARSAPKRLLDVAPGAAANG
jgi:hypothetical protein